MLTYSRESTLEDIQELLAKPKGTIVKVLNYETVMLYIEEEKEEGSPFEITTIDPGTKLFAQYGPDHCVVTVAHS